MFPQAAAGHGSLAIVYICLNIVSINDVFTLRPFPANIEIVKHDKGTTIDVANSMNLHAETSRICFIGLPLFSPTLLCLEIIDSP